MARRMAWPGDGRYVGARTRSMSVAGGELGSLRARGRVCRGCVSGPSVETSRVIGCIVYTHSCTVPVPVYRTISREGFSTHAT